MPKVGINGFGRIGRLVLRVLISRQMPVDLVAVNDPFLQADAMAYMFRYDTMHGRFPGTVVGKDGKLIITYEGKTYEILCLACKDPKDCKWGELGVEWVIESSGAFTTTEKAGAHLAGGAKKVLITAPSADAPMFVYGVNHTTMKADHDHHLQRFLHH